LYLLTKRLSQSRKFLTRTKYLPVSFQYFGEIVVTRWFRYGGGIAPPPTQPPIIKKIHLPGQSVL
jgi:hypothetical protein